jgi:hypothetical protein
MPSRFGGALLRGLGKGRFGRVSMIPLIDGQTHVAAGDVNGDGRLDAVFGGPFSMSLAPVNRALLHVAINQIGTTMSSCATDHGDTPSTHHFFDAKRTHHINEVVDLGGPTGHFDDHGRYRYIDNLGTKYLSKCHYLGTLLTRDMQFHQGHLAFNRRIIGDVADFEHLDQPVELLDHLFDMVRFYHDGHPANASGLGMTNRQTRNIITTPAKHADGAI